MTRMNFNPSFLLLTAALAMPLVGCGSDGEETETPDEGTPTAAPTPTVAPTPTPTPVPPFDKWQALTAFQIAGASQGLDYDGDQTKDNAIHGAFEAIQDGILEAVNAAIDSQTDYPAPGDPCETSTQGCTLTPPQAATAKGAAEQLITGLISVEAINSALTAIFDGGARPYAINIEEGSSDYVLTYWTGNLNASGAYVTEGASIGTQVGDLNLNGGLSKFGPGSFEFSTEIGGRDPQTIGFQVYDALTELTYNANTINTAFTGGGVKIAALSDLVEQVLQALVDAGAPLPDDFDIDETVSGIETTLINASDITCDGGSDCFSITFSYNSTAVEAAN